MSFPNLGDPRIECLFAAPRGFSQLNHVLRRLLVPRHPHVHLIVA